MPAPKDNAGASAEGRDPPDPLLGQQVRDFQIVECLGRGGMGAVYKATHVLLGETRALKVIRGDVFASVPQAGARFQREARIAVRLRHANLVLIHDFFIEAGNHFLVMEYVVGESLAHRLRRKGPLSVEGACRIALQCCDGLAHAHDLGIVHRDLSPGNVMLTPSPAGPQVKIIDFGIARVVQSQDETVSSGEDATLTRFGDFLGKPRYASPEQAGLLRRGEQLDQRSDLYSLGLIFYEMLTADLPFHADTAVGYLSLHLTERPEPPSRRHPNLRIPRELERVILRCLEKDRSLRFPDARALAQAIEAIVPRQPAGAAEARAPLRGPRSARTVEMKQARSAARPASAEPEPPADRADAPRRRALALAALGGVALAALVAGGVGYRAWSGRDAEPPSIPALQRATPEPEPTPQAVTPAPVDEARAPDAPSSPPPPSAPVAESEAAPAVGPTAETTATVVQEAPATADVRPAPAPSPAPLSAPEPAPQPAPADRARVAPPRAEPRVARAVPPTAAPRAPAPAPAPAPRAAAPFAGDAEMRAAYDDAAAFEQGHDPRAAIQRWKAFRARGPSPMYDEQARRRITALSLAQLRRLD